MPALIFDCDGVLADTERDGHRPAFNQAFAEAGLDVVWDDEEYGRRLQIGGGKERIASLFDDAGEPVIRADPYGWNDRVAVALGLGTSASYKPAARDADVGP